MRHMNAFGQATNRKAMLYYTGVLAWTRTRGGCLALEVHQLTSDGVGCSSDVLVSLDRMRNWMIMLFIQIRVHEVICDR